MSLHFPLVLPRELPQLHQYADTAPVSITAVAAGTVPEIINWAWKWSVMDQVTENRETGRDFVLTWIKTKSN